MAESRHATALHCRDDTDNLHTLEADGASSRNSMPFHCEIADGPRGGLSFDFIPCDHSFAGVFDEDRHGPDVFSIPEEAFLFIEAVIAEAFPDWQKGYYWGVSWLPKAVWLEAFQSLDSLRFNLRTGIHPKVILLKHVRRPGLLNANFRLHRRAILDFLDQFERRARKVLESYPYLLIHGI